MSLLAWDRAQVPPVRARVLQILARATSHQHAQPHHALLQVERAAMRLCAPSAPSEPELHKDADGFATSARDLLVAETSIPADQVRHPHARACWSVRQILFAPAWHCRHASQ